MHIPGTPQKTSPSDFTTEIGSRGKQVGGKGWKVRDPKKGTRRRSSAFSPDTSPCKTRRMYWCVPCPSNMTPFSTLLLCCKNFPMIPIMKNCPWVLLLVRQSHEELGHCITKVGISSCYRGPSKSSPTWCWLCWPWKHLWSLPRKGNTALVLLECSILPPSLFHLWEPSATMSLWHTSRRMLAAIDLKCYKAQRHSISGVWRKGKVRKKNYVQTRRTKKEDWWHKLNRE